MINPTLPETMVNLLALAQRYAEHLPYVLLALVAINILLVLSNCIEVK